MYIRVVHTSASGIHVSKRIINIRPSARGALSYADAISKVLSHVWAFRQKGLRPIDSIRINAR